jgi:hypothetical protein
MDGYSPNVRFVPKADMDGYSPNVRFVPKADMPDGRSMLDWLSGPTQNYRRWFPQGIKRERGACVLSIRAMPRLPPQL